MSMFRTCSASLAGTVVSTLAQSSFNAGMEAVMLSAAGNHQAEFVALMRQLARGTISTRKIDALSDVAIGASNIIFRSVAQGGVGGSQYKSIAGGATTMAVPRRVTWSAGGTAILDAELIFLSSNGTTAPITIGTATGALTEEADVWVGSGTGISQITVDFGFDIQIPQDGHLYAINAFIASQRPRISYVTNSDEDFITAKFNPGAIGSLTATFSKLADGGVRNGTKTFTLSGHVYVESVSSGTPGTVTVRCEGTDGITVA
jgi:hypothetical protein